jgi:hypothetical protein
MKNTIQFNSDRRTGTEVLRLSSDGIWANPDIPADDAAKKVLEALDSNIKVMVQKAVEAEREKVAAWMMERGYATGHGDTIEDLLKELKWQIREQEREACAKLCEPQSAWDDPLTAYEIAKAIRARGEQ